MFLVVTTPTSFTLNLFNKIFAKIEPGMAPITLLAVKIPSNKGFSESEYPRTDCNSSKIPFKTAIFYKLFLLDIL